METAFIFIQCIILAACGTLWVRRITVQAREGDLLETREHPATPIGLIDIGIAVFIWFAFQLVGLVLVTQSMGIDLSALESDPLSAEQTLELGGKMAVMQLAATLLSIAVILLTRHRLIPWLGSVKNLHSDVVVGITSSLMLIPLVMLIQFTVTKLIPYTHPTLDSLTENFSGMTAMWAWIAAVGIAPVTEEFFFRGLIQGWLQRVFDYDEAKDAWFTGGPVDHETSRDQPEEPEVLKLLRFWAPIVITSGAFASVHFGQGPAPIPLFFLSLGIGYVFRRTGSLLPCIIIHVLLNAISLTILTLGIMYPELLPQEPDTVPAFSNFLQ